jgi:hypothetical protein
VQGSLSLYGVFAKQEKYLGVKVNGFRVQGLGG